MNDACCLRALLAIGINMAHNVMANNLLARLRHVIVNVIGMCLQLIDLLLRDDGLSVLRKAKLHLRFSQGNPKLSPGSEFHVRGKDKLHFLAGITL